MLRTALKFAPACLLPLAACSGGGDDSNSFQVSNAVHAVDSTAAVVVDGPWLVYVADEATSGAAGTDLNGDTDTTDDVAVVQRLSGGDPTPLAASVDIAIVGNEIYLVVDEAEDVDWDGDVADNHVLLHWSQATDMLVFVDVIAPAALAADPMIALGDRLYYASTATPTGDETTLRLIEQADPTVPVVVSNMAGGGALAPVILGEADGLLFLALDETDAPTVSPDYNGDADSTDIAVLALLDASDAAETVVVVPAALSGLDAPFDAQVLSTDPDWTVAFLVNEAAQGDTNLNDPALANVVPDSCGATPDADTSDDVLHFATYSDLALLTAPTNAVLAGRDRVVALQDYVATLSDETDASCDMNEDTDTTDTMVRWVETVTPVTPPRDPSQLHAVFDVPGGSMGLTALSDRFVMVVDEAADDDDINSDGSTDDTLIGWLDPTDSIPVGPFWEFSHPDTNPGTGITGLNHVGVSWMASEISEGRLPLAFMEEPFGDTLNVDLLCDFNEKDTDAVDSLPVWADFASGGTILDFDGQGYAVHLADPGITVIGGWVFYRVSEASDNFDYNNDGDQTDVILVRNPQLTCDTTIMATASSLPGPTPVVYSDGVTGGAFISSEFQAAVDFNGDGDFNDLVPRYFRF